jgi:hypothetical protein
VVSEIRSYQMTVPAGTLITAPSVQAITFPPRVVSGIRWKVPPGPSGLMGWALTIGGSPVIPRVHGTYFVTDNDADTWTLEGYPDQGQWQFTAYNTDIYPHTVYLDFLLDQIVTTAPMPAQIPSTDLSSAPAVALPSAPPLIVVPAAGV